MLRYLCRRVFKGLPLKKFRQRGRIPGFFLRLPFECRRKTAFYLFPPGRKDGLSFGGKFFSRAGKNRRNRFKGVRYGGCHT